MSSHVYRLSEIVGSSPTSVDDAIRTAIRKAAGTVRNIEWFEVGQIRGHVENVLAKLELRSRTQVAALLAAGGGAAR